MSARQEMARLLDQWLQLTQAEAGAIQSASWAALRNIQSAKSLLQKDVARAGEKWQVENPGKPLPCGNQHPFRAELSRLLSMATRNGELLVAQLRRARARQESLDNAARNLRKIQRAYSSRSAAGLDHYS
jgi:hypothetical protein